MSDADFVSLYGYTKDQLLVQQIVIMTIVIVANLIVWGLFWRAVNDWWRRHM